jgi:hypothetical protein
MAVSNGPCLLTSQKGKDDAPLDDWEVMDSPLPFDSSLSFVTDGSIAAGETKTYTSTITESLPSESDHNLGFEDTVNNCFSRR